MSIASNIPVSERLWEKALIAPMALVRIRPYIGNKGHMASPMVEIVRMIVEWLHAVRTRKPGTVTYFYIDTRRFLKKF